jgi:gentisate 1,2-dioxygenase
MSSQLQELYRDLTPLSLAPLWESLHELVTSEPRTKMQAAMWQYQAVRPLLLRAGAAISAQQAVRRVLILENPAATGSACITTSLYAGLQLILPGEIAPAHRHTQSAFRFIVEGHGAFTTVNGERFAMYPGDLILTPNMCWHDHGHDGTEPVVWLDGLDIPLVRSLDASFAETYVTDQQVQLKQSAGRSQQFYYPYQDWYKKLQSLAYSSESIGTDGSYQLEFTNPLTGGPVLPTMSAFGSLLPSGTITRPQRRTDGWVGCIVQGELEVQCETQKFNATVHDTFVVPSWQRYTLRTTSQEPAIVFSYSDQATQRALGLWHHEYL